MATDVIETYVVEPSFKSDATSDMLTRHYMQATNRRKAYIDKHKARREKENTDLRRNREEGDKINAHLLLYQRLNELIRQVDNEDEEIKLHMKRKAALVIERDEAERIMFGKK